MATKAYRDWISGSKRLEEGPERLFSWPGRAPEPFFAGGKMRNLERLKWWEDYAAEDGRQPVWSPHAQACMVIFKGFYAFLGGGYTAFFLDD